MKISYTPRMSVRNLYVIHTLLLSGVQRSNTTHFHSTNVFFILNATFGRRFVLSEWSGGHNTWRRRAFTLHAYESEQFRSHTSTQRLFRHVCLIYCYFSDDANTSTGRSDWLFLFYFFFYCILMKVPSCRMHSFNVFLCEDKKSDHEIRSS